MLFKATIDVLIDADHETDACDAIAEALRPILREFSTEPSAWIDWRYHHSNTLPTPDTGKGFEYSA